MAETLIYSAEAGAPEPSYTRLLVTDATGPHRGAILLVYDDGLPAAAGRPVFPVYRSDDHGRSWHRAGAIADTAFGLGHRYQPTLLELSAPVGDLPAGTLVASGNAIPPDLAQTRLPLYASTDGGTTWAYLSEIDHGGPAKYDPAPDSTTSAVWEPELRQLGDTVVCYYSDERYKSCGMLQTLVRRSTTDLRSWTERSLVFGVADRRTRPGMLVTTPQLPTGEVFGVLEIVGGPGVPVHFVHSPDGLDWGTTDGLGHRILSIDGTTLSGSPVISRSSAAGRTVLLVTGRTAIDAHGNAVNRALWRTANPGPWHDIELPVHAAPTLAHEMAGYSQSLVLAVDGRTLVHATGRRNHVGNLDVVVGTGEFAAPH